MKAQLLYSFLFIGQVPWNPFLSKRNVLFLILVNQHKPKQNQKKKKNTKNLIYIGISSIGYFPVSFRSTCCCKPRKTKQNKKHLGGKTQGFHKHCNQLSIGSWWPHSGEKPWTWNQDVSSLDDLLWTNLWCFLLLLRTKWLLSSPTIPCCLPV